MSTASERQLARVALHHIWKNLDATRLNTRPDDSISVTLDRAHWHALFSAAVIPSDVTTPHEGFPSPEPQPACGSVNPGGFGKPVVTCTRTVPHKNHSAPWNGQVLVW